MTLIARLPESLPAPDAAFTWIEKDAGGRVVRTGEHPYEPMPRDGRLELVAPAARVLLSEAMLPRRSRQHTRQLLDFAVETRITGEPESVHVALGPQIAANTYALAAVDREWLKRWLEWFSEAEQAPQSMRVETCLVPIEAGTWSIVQRGSGGFVRTGIAAGMAFDDDGQPAPPMILRLALNEALAEGRAPERLVVFPADERAPDLERWSSALGVACELRDHRDWSEDTRDAAVELLQGEFSPASKAREYLPLFRPALILCGLIAALHVVGTVVHWTALSRERSALRSEMHALFRSAFPPPSAMADPPLQMRRKLDTLRGAAGHAQADDFLPLLADAASRLDGAAYERITGVTYERGRLLVDVQLEQRSDVNALLERLGNGHARASLDAVNPRGRGVEARFAFSAKGGA